MHYGISSDPKRMVTNVSDALTERRVRMETTTILLAVVKNKITEKRYILLFIYAKIVAWSDCL